MRAPCLAAAAVALAIFGAACDGRDAGGAGVGPRAADRRMTAEPWPDDSPRRQLEDLFAEIGFQPYLAFRPAYDEPGEGGFTDYYFDVRDFRCFHGLPAHVSVSPGASDNVVLFLDGGGAQWPGGGLSLDGDNPLLYPILQRTADNPADDWNYVYAPYCDASLRLGDNIYEYPWGEGYHQGVRHAAAAVALAKRLFPNAPKVFVAGVSAGGFGALFAWAMVKSQYPTAETYVLSDSGAGFWNPDDPALWQTMATAWNVRLPSACARCDGPVMTYLWETYMELDPQLRVGLFSSYQDWVMSAFTGLTPARFEQCLMAITGEVKRAQPARFGRFFVDGGQHTSLGAGLGRVIDGVSYGEWIRRLIDNDAAWTDELE